MALKNELEQYVAKTLKDAWTTRAGQKVPDTPDLKLSNDGVELDAVVLYADMADSTALVKDQSAKFAAEVYKSYLYCASRIITSNGGVITAYDGDRVMAVFLGGSKNSNGAKAGLQLNWATQNIVQPALKSQYPHKSFTLKQKVGIDASTLLVARTGIRGSNDLVWVGTAANNAAKMAALGTAYSTYISAAVYGSLSSATKSTKDGRDMWTNLGSSQLGYKIFGSTFWWPLS